MNDQDEMFERATETPIGEVKVEGEQMNVPLAHFPSGADGVETAKKEFKFGLLSNGVQMIRFASGPTVTLIGKRERGPHERQGGRTDKIIYKVTVDREEKHASVYIDGVNKINFGGGSSGLLEHGALAMINCIIEYNARQQRHKRARLNRRKAEAAAANPPTPKATEDNGEGK